MSLFIGIDIGTTHVKAIAANEMSAIVCEEKASYPIYQPQDGYAEQDADEIFTALLHVFRRLIARINTREIATVSFSSAYHSILAADKDGNALTPLITWADIRSNEYAKQLKKSEHGHSIYLKTGVPVHPMSPLCKIAWIRDHQPDVFKKAFKFISMKEYAWYKLFGRFQVDYSIASATGLFDSNELVWCDEALAFCGITTNHLSKPVPVLHSETQLQPHYKAEFNLKEDTMFVAGAGDGATANLGCGALLPGIAALTIGTSGAIRVVTEKRIQDEKGSIFSYILAGKLFINGGAINNGGIALQWFLQTFLQKQSATEKDYEWMFAEIADVPKGADGLLFLPYILGERAPVWDADAKGAFVGIRSTHTLKYFMRAVIEGICFSLLQVLNNIEQKSTVDVLYATGGFTQSEMWLQLLADILDKKICVLNTADASAMGAIYMGMRVKGVIQDWDDIKQFAITQKEFLPAGDREKVYAKHISIFNNLYDKLKHD